MVWPRHCKSTLQSIWLIAYCMMKPQTRTGRVLLQDDSAPSTGHEGWVSGLMRMKAMLIIYAGLHTHYISIRMNRYRSNVLDSALYHHPEDVHGSCTVLETWRIYAKLFLWLESAQHLNYRSVVFVTHLYVHLRYWVEIMILLMGVSLDPKSTGAGKRKIKRLVKEELETSLGIKIYFLLNRYFISRLRFLSMGLDYDQLFNLFKSNQRNIVPIRTVIVSATTF